MLLSFFPNPIKDIITVNANFGLKQEYKIYSSCGKVLLSGALNSNNNQINLSKLPCGLYFISINGTSLKLVKK
jgi:hypothetical protein